MLLFAQGSGGSSTLLQFLPIVAIIALMYFFMIRPQNKRRQEAQAMRDSLGVGDDVETVGGLRGVVSSIADDSVTIEASPGVYLSFARGAIGKVMRAEPVEEAVDQVDDEDKHR